MQNGKEVFANTIKWRAEKDFIFTGDGNKCPLNGEQTLLLDISGMTQTGDNFVIQIDGIGSSLPFSVSNKSIFNAFFTHMKGLYQQRTGITHEKPYTNWEYAAHHKGIYVAHHIPNNAQYWSIYHTDTMEKINFTISQFEMIEATKTDEYWEDVYGGHADAGDYDNRPYHLRMVDGLAAVWHAKKEILLDNQLNIPESNDGIPDILNEMEWSLEIHYNHRDVLVMEVCPPG